MKHKKALLILTIIPFMAGCANKGGGVVDPIPYVEPDPEVKTDSVYLGFKEIKSYTPTDSVTFVVTVDDESIVTYNKDYKYFTSNTKAGTTKVHFVSSKLTYNVDVTVKDDETAPNFELDESSLVLDKGSTYSVKASLYYRGINAFEESDGLHSTLESESAPISSLEINKDTIKVTANNVGKDVYTIYTTFLGHTVSRQLTVSVIENKAFVVIGKKLEFKDGKPLYNVSMHNYSSNKLNIKNDLIVTKSGQKIAYDNLTVDIVDKTVATLGADGVISVLKSGDTTLKITYGEDVQNVTIHVYKPVIETVDMTLTDKKFPMNLTLTVDVSNKTRTYKGEKTVTKDIPLPTSSHTFTGVNSISVNGKTRYNTTETPLTYASNKATITSASFDIDCAGELETTLTMEAADYLVAYKFDMLYVTKEFKIKNDCDTYLSQKFPSDTIYGYYTLGQDVDFANYAPGQAWFSGIQDVASAGFQGVIDGAKTYDESGKVTEVYNIKNLKASPYGLTVVTGQNAIIRNLGFTNVNFNTTNGDSLFSRFTVGGTFENIKVTFNSASTLDQWRTIESKDPVGAGLLSSQKVSNAIFKDWVIDSSNINTSIISLCGKNGSNNSFDNFKIKCKDIIYYSNGTLFNPETGEPTNGIKFADTEIPGIIIEKI